MSVDGADMGEMTIGAVGVEIVTLDVAVETWIAEGFDGLAHLGTGAPHLGTQTHTFHEEVVGAGRITDEGLHHQL